MLRTLKGTGRQYKRIVFGGEPSVGKTTAASNWCKNSLWIDLDERIPEEIVGNCTILEGIRNYSSLIVSLQAIEKEASIPYKAIIIDTFTLVEMMAKNHSVEVDFKGNLDNYSDYSKGDKNNLPNHINNVLALLDKIAKKFSCDIVIICHSEVKPFKNTNGENYDKAMLCLTEKIRNRVLQWADLVGYAWNDVNLIKQGMVKKADGKSVKMISFNYDPRFDAKGDATIPLDIEFDFEGKWVNIVKESLGKGKNKPVLQPSTQTVKQEIKV